MDSVLDRAREWVNEHYPDADGAEWERLVEEASKEIAALDEAADAAEVG